MRKSIICKLIKLQSPERAIKVLQGHREYPHCLISLIQIRGLRHAPLVGKGSVGLKSREYALS